MGVPPNHLFSWDFPLQTIRFGVSPFMEKFHMVHNPAIIIFATMSQARVSNQLVMLNQQSVSAGRLRVCEPPAGFKVWRVLRGTVDSLLIFLLLGNGKGALMKQKYQEITSYSFYEQGFDRALECIMLLQKFRFSRCKYQEKGPTFSKNAVTMKEPHDSLLHECLLGAQKHRSLDTRATSIYG